MKTSNLFLIRPILFQKGLIVTLILTIILGSCKKDPSSESLIGVWDLYRLKVNGIFVNSKTTNDVLVQIILNSDFSGEYTWADNGVNNSNEVFSWNADNGILTLTIGGIDPYTDEYVYFLEENKLQIEYGDYECIFNKSGD